MKILVTGASGFVGGTIMERGAAAGHEVFGVARRHLDRPDYTSIDLGTTGLDEVDLPWEPDAIIHAAALAAPFGPRSAYESANVEATRRVVAYAEAHGRPRLVYVSSSSVLYDEHDQLDLTENAPPGPDGFVNEYARTKAAGEEVTRGYSGSWVIARPRAVFGPGDTVLFPRIIAAAQAGRLPLLTGRDTPAMGDVIYVDNLADYLLALAGNDLDGVYHLTNAEPVDMHRLLLDVLARLGFDPPTREVPLRRALLAATVIENGWRLLRLRGEPPITRYGVGVLAHSKTFDPTKMVRDLGSPAVSIDEGIDRFVAWQRTRL